MYGSKSKGPRCFGYAGGLNQTNPLKIRVLNFASFTSGTQFSLSFDGFNNPPSQILFLVPINVRISLQDRTNGKTYTSYFPQVYASDSINVGVPASIGGGSLSYSNLYRGASNFYYYALTWPYSSSTSNSQKIVLKIGGGATCCQTFSSLLLNDTESTYTLLWSNPLLNMSVWKTPTKTFNTVTGFAVKNIINPQAVSM